jgi:hypothetical protein
MRKSLSADDLAGNVPARERPRLRKPLILRLANADIDERLKQKAPETPPAPHLFYPSIILP